MSRHQSHDHEPRTRNAPPKKLRPPNAKSLDVSIDIGSNSSRRRSPKPLTSTSSAPCSRRDLDTSQSSRRRPSSNPRRPQRAGSADVPRAALQRSGSFGSGRRRSRSNERDVVMLSQSHHCSSRRSYKRKEALSLSLHGPTTQGVTMDALQRNFMARLERSESESDMKIDTTIFDDDGKFKARSRSPNCCAVSHDGVINPNTTSATSDFIPVSIKIGPNTDVSNSMDDSGETFVQFYPEGVKEVSIGSKIKQLTRLDHSKLTEESCKRSKGIGGVLHRLAGKGKGADKKPDGANKMMKATTAATYDVNDSDIESQSDDGSVSSFASDTSL